MKVAVAAIAPELDAATDQRFGRCAWIVVVDTESLELEAIENPGALAGTGAGIAAAQLVADAGADAVVAGSFGPNSIAAFKAGGIRLYKAAGTVRGAALAAADGTLQEL